VALSAAVSLACGAGCGGGKLAENDTGLDIDDIESAYMRAEGNHFWIAETDGKLTGCIAVVGLSSEAMQKMMNVDEPDYGHLLDEICGDPAVGSPGG
jgi:2-keto-4-pentenoate hydratase